MAVIAAPSSTDDDLYGFLDAQFQHTILTRSLRRAWRLIRAFTRTGGDEGSKPCKVVWTRLETRSGTFQRHLLSRPGLHFITRMLFSMAESLRREKSQYMTSRPPPMLFLMSALRRLDSCQVRKSSTHVKIICPIRDFSSPTGTPFLVDMHLQSDRCRWTVESGAQGGGVAYLQACKEASLGKSQMSAFTKSLRIISNCSYTCGCPRLG